MYSIAVCDDEPAIRRQIMEMLHAHPDRDGFLVSEFSNGEALLERLRAGENFFLVILDIELGAKSGIEIGKVLREELEDNSTQILYLSAYDQYAMELFDMRPLNFLLKPVDPEKFSACVTKALKLAPFLDAALTIFPDKQAQRVPLREIRYLESYNKRLTIHTTQGDYTCAQRLAQVMEQLPQPQFFQIHQSFAVNNHYVRRIQYDRLMLDDGMELSISQSYRKQVRQMIFQRIPSQQALHA